MANAWPPAIVEARGGWRFRWTNGVTRRANSALAIGSEEHVVDLVDEAEVFYRAHRAPTMFQVTTASAPPSLAPYLSARGYRPRARTIVMQAATPLVVERRRPHSFDIEMSDTPADEWFDTYWSVEATRAQDEASRDVVRNVLLAPALPTVFATARRDSEVVGVGELVLERGWGGVQCMATSPLQRRRGVANSVLGALADLALESGAGNMYLAVMADNEAATKLYRAAGYEPAHEYSYFSRHEV